MGVLDDILEPPPEDMTSREMAFAIVWSGCKWFFWCTVAIAGGALLLLLLILIIY